MVHVKTCFSTEPGDEARLTQDALGSDRLKRLLNPYPSCAS